MLGQKRGECGHIMAETDKYLCGVRCRECDLVTNPCDVCTGMTEQERRRMQRSGSVGSGTSVADSVGSRRGSTRSLDFGRRGKRRIRMLLAYAGRGIGGPSGVQDSVSSWGPEWP